MKQILLVAALFGAFILPAYAESLLEDVTWLRLPETESVFYPPLTVDEEFNGRLEFECRIRDEEGHVDCDVPEIDPHDLYIAEHAVVLAERVAQVDMKATPGAAVGKRVRLKLTFT